MQRVNAGPTFTDLAASVAGVFKAGDAADAAGAGGRPHWPVVTMVKVIFLQKCFGLSDPMAEEMLRDRIGFRRFAGLSFDDVTPDETTICEFRGRLRVAGHGSPLFDEALAVLRERGAGARERHPHRRDDPGGAVVPPPRPRPEGVDARAEPADRPRAGVRRAPVRLVQAADEQPPRAVPRGRAERAGLRADGRRVQLLPGDRPATRCCRGLTRASPRAALYMASEEPTPGLTRGVGSARELNRLGAESKPYQWLCGGVSLKCHTPSDFRVGHAGRWTGCSRR